MIELGNRNTPPPKQNVKLEYIIGLMFLGIFTYGVAFVLGLIGLAYLDSTNVTYSKGQYAESFRTAKKGNKFLVISLIVCGVASLILLFLRVLSFYKAAADYLHLSY